MSDMVKIFSPGGDCVRYVAVSQPATVTLHPRPETSRAKPSILRPEVDKTVMAGEARLELPQHSQHVMTGTSTIVL